MANSSTSIEIGDNSFDIAGIGSWVNENIWLCLLIAAIAFIFWLFQKGGFAEKLLEYRIKTRELDAQQLDDARALADMLRRRYDRDDPLLPFDDPDDLRP